MSWPCFWVELTGDAQYTLRRYAEADGGCTAGQSYHNASVPIFRGPQRRGPDGTWEAVHAEEFKDRPEWPAACPCGYEFGPEDHWQANQEPIYVDRATGREWPQRGLSVGAMFDSLWNHHWGVGPDGIALMVVLPPEPPTGDTRSNWWHVDGPSSSEGGRKSNAWSLTGDPRDPPTLTVTPSILTDKYHGFLTNGVLTDPI